MKKVLLSLLVISSLSLMLGCDDEEDKKDAAGGGGVPATQTGAGTMGATVDGAAWVAGYNVPGVPAQTAWGVATGGYIVAWGMKVNLNTSTLVGKTESIGLYVAATAPGTYNLTFGAGTNYGTYTILETTGGGTTTTKNQTYITNATNATGSVTITKYDTANKILSGTFNFKAEYTDPKTLVKSYVDIKNGVFDIKY